MYNIFRIKHITFYNSLFGWFKQCGFVRFCNFVPHDFQNCYPPKKSRLVFKVVIVQAGIQPFCLANL